MAKYAYLTTNLFDANEIAAEFNGQWLRSEDIDISVAQSPHLFGYEIYGDVGRYFDLKNFDFSLNFGVGYNFVSQNSSTQGWLLNFKAEIFF